MTKLTQTVALGLAMLAGPSLAQDAAAGEDAYKKCKACHSVIGDDGTEFQKGGKTGPNLYGIIGRPVASVPGFAYGEAILAVGASGAVWDEASLAAYLVNPAAWLQEKTGDAGAKSKMSFKLAAGGEDVAAYLASVQ